MSAILDLMAARLDPTDADLAARGLYRCPTCREVLPRGIECEGCEDDAGGDDEQ